MIHLDTNLLIDLVTIGHPTALVVEDWIRDGHPLAVSAVAWSEFLNGPHTRQQKESVLAVVGQRVIDFGVKQAEQASKLFHLTGRKRGSHADCMIAAAAMVQDCFVATRNIADFERFEPHGLKLIKVPTMAERANASSPQRADLAALQKGPPHEKDHCRAAASAPAAPPSALAS
jgi:predicted nucleic acid-binding protein